MSNTVQDVTIIKSLCFSYAEAWKVSPKSEMVPVIVIGLKRQPNKTWHINQCTKRWALITVLKTTMNKTFHWKYCVSKGLNLHTITHLNTCQILCNMRHDYYRSVFFICHSPKVSPKSAMVPVIVICKKRRPNKTSH